MLLYLDDKRWISEFADSSIECTQSEEKKENRLKIMNNFSDLWGNNKCPNIHIIGIPGEDSGTEKVFKNS